MTRDLFLSAAFYFLFNSSFAQEVKLPGMCKPFLDSMITEITVDIAVKWAETAPIKVACDDGRQYKLHYYEFNIFTMNPMQNREFGIGDEKGIPLLALNALKKLKTKDTVILKNVKYLDAAGKEQKLTAVSFQIQ